MLMIKLQELSAGSHKLCLVLCRGALKHLPEGTPMLQPGMGQSTRSSGVIRPRVSLQAGVFSLLQFHCITRTLALQILDHTKRFTYLISSPELWRKLTCWSTWRVRDDKSKQRRGKANGLPSPSRYFMESFCLLDSPLSFPHKQALGQRAWLHRGKCFASTGVAAILRWQSALMQLIPVKPCW